MDIVLEEWMIYCIVAGVVLIVVIPLLSFLIHRLLNAKREQAKKKAESPTTTHDLYTTTAPIIDSDDKSLDYGSVNGASPEGSSYVPASYSDILNTVDQGSISGSTVDLRQDPYLSLDNSLTEHRSSLVLSTFYSSEPSLGGSNLTTPIGSPAPPNFINSPVDNKDDYTIP